MATAKAHSKKQRRKRAANKKKTGVLRGMRSGFKNVATTVTKSEKPASKTGAIISTAVTLLLIAAIAALLFYR